jgi:hypothetical protein
MRALILILCFLVLAPAAPAEELTRAELFALYVRRVDRALVAQRMEQLFVGLEPGAFKTQAAGILKADLAAAIQAQRDLIAARVTNELEADAVNVGDTDL